MVVRKPFTIFKRWKYHNKEQKNTLISTSQLPVTEGFCENEANPAMFLDQYSLLPFELLILHFHTSE